MGRGRDERVARTFPPRFYAGLALAAVAWTLSWGLGGLRTHLLFAPQWLGYVLAVDGWVERRAGPSMWARAPRTLLAMFALSVPIWWLFELLNLRLANWRYLGREHFSDLEYALLASISFATVVPAVLESAELVATLPWMQRLARGPRLLPSAGLERALLAAGALMLCALLAWPRVCFPLAWVAPVFLLEPCARWLGRRSLLDDLARGDWRPWMSLWGGGLLCGFFWEMWNALAYPKWVYDIPGVGFGKVFEMPILGYLGYLPFALALFLVAQLALPGARDLRLGGGATGSAAGGARGDVDGCDASGSSAPPF